MQNSRTFSILFWIHPSRIKNNQSKIYARITVDGIRQNISLKQEADIRTWEPLRQKARGNNEISKLLNEYLDKVRAELVNCYQKLLLGKKLVTAELIKSSYLGQNEQRKTLLDILDYHSKKIGNTLTKGSIRNFGVSEGYLKRFLSRKLKTSNVYL